MDKRMYRGTTGNQSGYNRGAAPYRMPDCDCDDGGYAPDDRYMRDSFDDGGLENFPIGMSYVPWQRFRDLQENEFVALAKGTVFKELDLDWYGRGCR